MQQARVVLRVFKDKGTKGERKVQEEEEGEWEKKGREEGKDTGWEEG